MYTFFFLFSRLVLLKLVHLYHNMYDGIFSLAFFDKFIVICEQKVFIIEGLLFPVTFYPTPMFMRPAQKDRRARMAMTTRDPRCVQAL